MKKALFAFLLWGLCCGAAAAADDYRWIGQITEDGAALRYGIPDSDAIKIDFHCDRATKKIAVSYEHEPKDAKDGMRLTLRLSARGRGPADGIAFAVSGERLALDDKFVLQGEIRMSPQLRRILAADGVLRVEAGGLVEEIPLPGAGRAARQLFATCP